MKNASDLQSAGIFRGLLRFVALPRPERLLLVEAVTWLGLFRAVILTIPFRRIAPHLGAHMSQTPFREEMKEQYRLAMAVALAINRASRYVPWEAKCLVQAMAGKKMLKRRGIETTLYLGLARKTDLALQAHAWLRCGDKIILGECGLKSFTVVATFGKSSRGRNK